MDPYLGEIRMFAGNFAPQGWQFCNGQTLPIQQYAGLFTLLGTTYGGNGQTNFGLPNLQGRVPMHWGSGQGVSPRTLGEMSGSEQVQLLPTQMPTHNHLVSVNGGGGNQESPTDNFIAQVVDPAQGTVLTAFTTSGNATMNQNSITMAGGSQPHSNMQPYLCVSFIIAVQGLFPPRP